MAKSVPNPERFRKKTEELQTRERPEIIKDLEGLPLSVAKLLVGKLKQSGRLSEAKRDPNDILSDIRETETDIDRTFDKNQHLPHVKRLDKLHAEYKKVTGERPPSQPTN